MRRLINPSHFLRERPKKQKQAKSPIHESAIKHVTGLARYVDDMPEPANMLHLAAGTSSIAYGEIISLDLSDVEAAEGVKAIITVDDIPGHIDIGPVYGGDPLLSSSTVEFIGQPLFFVAASSYDAANRAIKLAKVEYKPLEAITSISAAREANAQVLPTHTMKRGDADTAIKNAAHIIEGEMNIGGQEHFYLEGQVSTALPTEDGGMQIYTSSQHPAEVQKLVAEVLALPLHKVHTEVRRMGGGFGGKETQAAPLACAAALAAYITGHAVKYRMPRGKDMANTGKRHPLWAKYTVGVDENGLISGTKIELAGMCGCSPDLSEGVIDRSMFHADNSYFLNEAEVIGERSKTHTVSNTAFRGFGGPQGMAIAESIMEDIAATLKLDPLTVRERNLYQTGRDVTHYGQTIEQHQLANIIEKLKTDGNYPQRREAITAFNNSGSNLVKGLALTPVKFGISFTAQHLNQAGALVNIYTDGSIEVSHGGTEMGQGLYTKIAQIVANEFGVDVDQVNAAATRTDKVPNGSPTAASAGTDLNGKAAQNACITIRERLITFAAEHFNISEDSIIFDAGNVKLGDQIQSFAEFIQLAYFNRISLSSTGFYQTPKIYYDRETASGRPFFYYANGAALSEVIVDKLTGEYRVTAVDIIHDVGHSLNEAIDIGQIEGGFIQGMGWVTTEELQWDETGRVISNSPANYKIPTAFDVPKHFNVELWNEANREDTIYASKAVGEPPLMLALSVWAALKDACRNATGKDVKLDLPATQEKVFMAMNTREANQ